MKNEVKKYLEQVKREKLKPLVEEVVCAVDRYDNSPSIPNGSRMGDARSKLNAALQETARDVMEKFNLPPDEFNKIIESLKI